MNGGGVNSGRSSGNSIEKSQDALPFEFSSTVRFVERNGERYRVLLQDDVSQWLISFDSPAQPFCVVTSDMPEFQRVESPEDFECGDGVTSLAQQARLQLIQPLLDPVPSA